MDYLNKIEQNIFSDLHWNIPEQNQGIVSIIGGNSQSFRSSIKVAEFLKENYPIKKVNLVLPDALKSILPTVEDLEFLPSTESGSFGDDKSLMGTINSSDFNLILGDLSKNSITEKVIASACENSAKPLIITRDTVDLIANADIEKILMNENLIIFGSMAQIQKVFRAAYYPRMILLSQSLVQVTETLHKFTLSFPVAIITLHNNQIVIAKNGKVNVIPLEMSGYSPIMIWSGELAAKILALNLYNPNNFLSATSAAILGK